MVGEPGLGSGGALSCWVGKPCQGYTSHLCLPPSTLASVRKQAAKEWIGIKKHTIWWTMRAQCHFYHRVEWSLPQAQPREGPQDPAQHSW